MHGLAKRSFYLRLSPGPQPRLNVYCAFVTGGVFVVYRLGHLSSFNAFLIMGLAALVSCIIMVFQLTPLSRQRLAARTCAQPGESIGSMAGGLWPRAWWVDSELMFTSSGQ